MNNLTRSEFIKITAIAGGVIGASFISKEYFKQPYTITSTRTLMGTIIHLKIVCLDKIVGKSALENTFNEMERLVKIFNLRDEKSEISRLNKRGSLRAASADMLIVLSQAIKYGDLSSGAFDVTIQPVLNEVRAGKHINTDTKSLVGYKNISVTNSSVTLLNRGMKITLDGIAKGFVVDQGVNTLSRFGFDRVMVEAGGDLAVSGADMDKDGWRIGISSPRPNKLTGYLAGFTIKEGGVATSGDYINSFSEDKSSHHIIDPVSYQSPSELSSVTVVSSSAMEADALSTAIMVMGLEKGLLLANQLDQVEAVVVGKNMTLNRTNGFPKSSLR